MLRNEHSTEEKRKQHQKELAQLLNERPKIVWQSRANRRRSERFARIPCRTKVSARYHTKPKSRNYETVVMPIFGLPVPFHISTIKKVLQSVEGDHTYVRINFSHPGATMGRNEGGIYSQAEATFVKEVTYRSANTKESEKLSAPSSNLKNGFRLIKEVQKRLKTREGMPQVHKDIGAKFDRFSKSFIICFLIHILFCESICIIILYSKFDLTFKYVFVNIKHWPHKYITLLIRIFD